MLQHHIDKHTKHIYKNMQHLKERNGNMHDLKHATSGKIEVLIFPVSVKFLPNYVITKLTFRYNETPPDFDDFLPDSVIT